MASKKVKVDGGTKEAAKMLQGLDPEARKRVLGQMQQMDPSKTAEIENNMVVFEDLRHLTLTMFLELQREISQDDLALSLRIASNELRDHILSMLSSRIKQDVMDILKGPPKQIEEVQQAVENIMNIVRRKVDDGKLVLSSTGNDEYV